MFVLFVLALAKLTEHIRIDTGVFLHPFEGNEVDDISRCVHHHIGCQRFQPYGRYPDTVKGVIISLLNVFLNVVNLNVKRRKLFFEVDGKLVWTCPQCGNNDQDKMNVARRTCGYIGTQYWNQGRTQEIKERVMHL